MTTTVVVGAGSAGGVVAARLSEDPNEHVILIEAGPDYATIEEVPLDMKDPGQMSVTAHDWGLTGAFIEPPDSRKPESYPRGRVMGGSSSVNAAIAMRGTPEDFAGWAALGNDEWTWDDVLPFYIKLENDLDFGDQPYHGNSGPVPILRHGPDQWHPAAVAYRDAYLLRGVPDCPDVNEPGAFGVLPSPRNLLDGVRASSLVTYMRGARGRDNLEILADTSCTRIVFEGTTAIGVEVDSGGQRRFIAADRVVLSAGAIHSPQLLMLSGVGPAATLRELGIEVVVDSPGVGAVLEDHPIVPLIALAKHRSEFMGARAGRRLTTDIGRANGITNDAMEFAAVLEPSTMNLDIEASDLQAFPLIFNLSRPFSKGWLTITSSDYRVQPELHFNFLSDERDMARMATGVRDLYTLATETGLAEEIDSIPTLTVEIIQDTAAFEQWIRDTVTTGFHASTTCRMGPDGDEGAVVDQRLAVRGVDNLWIADASVNPVIPTAFTNLSAYMVGERLAVWLRAPGR